MKNAFGCLLRLLALATLFAAPASATDRELLGGPGGGLQRVECTGGSYLAGLEVMQGDWNDRISPICMFWDSQRLALRGEAPEQWVGRSGGGQFQSGICPDHGFVKRLTTSATLNEDNQPAFTQNTGVSCVSYLAPDTMNHSVRLNGSAGSANAWGESCPPGEVGAGILVRAGDFVDAIGLICGLPPSGSLFPRVPPPQDAVRAPPVISRGDIVHACRPRTPQACRQSTQVIIFAMCCCPLQTAIPRKSRN